ncbi:glycosyltransferase family 8 protein [Citrobacter sp. RHB25-C09]|uniref:glycosyltransferase family 8 protein n=1 Tax=Citrobacter sp. RHB25-C09 TaxID=2742624 RepID=UPI0015EF350D|nr:glycosyltransferase family 8 protein [Citrobacter sp. RHB25-C09]QMI03407.1 glycosyltransferase family 8 protein [Citrobacter sp. RHB25-C09]
MKNKTPINVVFCSDGNYIEYLATALTSVYLNNIQENIKFHVFSYDIDDDKLDKLKETSADITVYRLDADELAGFDNQSSLAHINKSTYIRLLVPRLLPVDVEYFVYLDVDVLCFSSLSELRDIDISGRICAVVSDNSDEINHKNNLRLGVDGDKYFNAGFMYVNKQRWLDNDIEFKTQNILSERKGALKYLDQDALNLALRDQVVFIDKKWNFLYTLLSEDKKESFLYNAEKLPVIMHFTGGRKPWYVEHTGAAQYLYLFYRNFTAWRLTPLRSYKERMRPTDYRVYARQAFRKGKLLDALKFYIGYLQKKCK